MSYVKPNVRPTGRTKGASSGFDLVGGIPFPEDRSVRRFDGDDLIGKSGAGTSLQLDGGMRQPPGGWGAYSGMTGFAQTPGYSPSTFTPGLSSGVSSNNITGGGSSGGFDTTFDPTVGTPAVVAADQQARDQLVQGVLEKYAELLGIDPKQHGMRIETNFMDTKASLDKMVRNGQITEAQYNKAINDAIADRDRAYANAPTYWVGDTEYPTHSQALAAAQQAIEDAGITRDEINTWNDANLAAYGLPPAVSPRIGADASLFEKIGDASSDAVSWLAEAADTTGDFKYTGEAFITSCALNAPNEDAATYSISLQGTGALTIAAN